LAVNQSDLNSQFFDQIVWIRAALDGTDIFPFDGERPGRDKLDSLKFWIRISESPEKCLEVTPAEWRRLVHKAIEEMAWEEVGKWRE
jgi:hypothetical protein